MHQLIYDEIELMRDHVYARPHVEAGRRLHGGFLADGAYQPPRALVRAPALGCWEAALAEQGGAVFAADASLLSGRRTPNVDQQRVLLRHGLGETFWNGLTITGKIEARGRFLADMPVPDIAAWVEEDISGMAIGHLGRGLLAAHGLDEGGQPASGVGGHDQMWFVARDMAFGEGAYPDVEPPGNIARPEAGRRWMPDVKEEVEGLLAFLMNLLMIEFRAEIGFASTQEVLRTPDLFPGRRAEAERAADIVGRIRIDEEIHVRSLCLYLGEARSLHFHTLDGATVLGADLIDPFWDGLVRWATIEQPAATSAQQSAVIEARIAAHPRADVVLAEFRAAGDVVAA